VGSDRQIVEALEALLLQHSCCTVCLLGVARFVLLVPVWLRTALGVTHITHARGGGQATGCCCWHQQVRQQHR